MMIEPDLCILESHLEPCKRVTIEHNLMTGDDNDD